MCRAIPGARTMKIPSRKRQEIERNVPRDAADLCDRSYSPTLRLVLQIPSPAEIVLDALQQPHPRIGYRPAKRRVQHLDDRKISPTHREGLTPGCVRTGKVSPPSRTLRPTNSPSRPAPGELLGRKNLQIKTDLPGEILNRIAPVPDTPDRHRGRTRHDIKQQNIAGGTEQEAR